MNYRDNRWRHKREVILRRDEYLCQECKRYGKTTLAEQVHHIFPADFYPEFKYNSHNLISLCTACHDKMHVRGTKELTELGKKWTERVREKLYPPTKNDRP